MMKVKGSSEGNLLLNLTSDETHADQNSPKNREEIRKIGLVGHLVYRVV